MQQLDSRIHFLHKEDRKIVEALPTDTLVSGHLHWRQPSQNAVWTRIWLLLGSGSSGGEMGEFSPPFFWAPFIPTAQALFYCIIAKIYPPISKSWIRACYSCLWANILVSGRSHLKGLQPRLFLVFMFP